MLILMQPAVRKSFGQIADCFITQIFPAHPMQNDLQLSDVLRLHKIIQIVDFFKHGPAHMIVPFFYVVQPLLKL